MHLKHVRVPTSKLRQWVFRYSEVSPRQSSRTPFVRELWLRFELELCLLLVVRAGHRQLVRRRKNDGQTD